MEKSGRIDTVILSAEQYQALKSQHDLASCAARKKAFETGLGDLLDGPPPRLTMPLANARQRAGVGLGCGVVGRHPSIARNHDVGVAPITCANARPKVLLRA